MNRWASSCWAKSRTGASITSEERCLYGMLGDGRSGVMSEELEKDLNGALTAARAAHSELMRVLSELNDKDLGLSLRGGWTIHRVVQHIGQSYGFYLAIILRARGSGDAEVSKVAITDFSSP